MNEHEITDLLTRAGDDRGRPLESDFGELLARARAERSRRRRRTGLGSLAAAAVVVLGVAVVPQLGRHHATDDPAAPPAPTAVPAPSPVVNDAQVLSRCRPPGAQWQLVHPRRTYRVGDLVALDGEDSSVLCQVPAAGRTAVVSSAAVYRAWSTAPRLGALCAELAPDDLPDLRRSTVVASSRADDGNTVAAVLRAPGGRFYSCESTPPDRAHGLGQVQPASDGLQGGTAPYDAEGGTTSATLVGPVGAGATTAVLGWTGGPSMTFPVSGGHVAAALVVPAPGKGPLRWRLESADGRVLQRGSF